MGTALEKMRLKQLILFFIIFIIYLFLPGCAGSSLLCWLFFSYGQLGATL